MTVEDELKDVLLPDEHVLWSAPISLARQSKAGAQHRRNLTLLLSALLSLGAILAGRGIYAIFDVNSSFIVGVASLALAVASLVGAFFTQKFRGKTEESSEVAIYGITDQRVVALSADGRLIDEIVRSEVEAVVWSDEQRRDELLLIRARDPDSERSFYITYVEEIAVAEEILLRNFIR